MKKHHSTQRDYWRSLEHLADAPALREQAQSEFAGYDPEGMLSMPTVTRRRFMKLMSASMALAGLTLSGCRRWPQEKLAPFTSMPHDRIPGVPQQFATVMETSGVGFPLLVTSFDGRPIKVEGNPIHPFSATVPGKIGATDAIAQASVLELYDPDRSRFVVDRSGGQDKPSTWDDFAAAFKPGPGLAILSEACAGPSMQRLKGEVLKKFPGTTWCEYEPINNDNEVAAFGQPMRQMLHLDQAAVVVSFDADPLGVGPARVKYAFDWSTRRRSADQGEMSRVYIAESTFSTTGSVADVRLAATTAQVRDLLRAVADQLNGGAKTQSTSAEANRWASHVIDDLKAHHGEAVVVVGCHLPPECHALGAQINAAIGAFGKTITLYSLPKDEAQQTQLEGLAKLVGQMKSGAVKQLLILGGNPVYDAPADLGFAAALKNVPMSAHLSLYDNETSAACKWHVNRAHYLEAWSDARAYDGTISIAQPLILALFDGKTPAQALSLLLGDATIGSDKIVEDTYAAMVSGGSDLAYRKGLDAGLYPGTGYKPVARPPQMKSPATKSAVANGMEIRFLPDSRVYDGRYAPNGWLQEMPDPLTKLVWDNAAIISIADAKAKGISSGDMLNVTVGNASVKIVAFVLPGQPQGVVGLPLGYGRTRAENIGTGVGFDVYPLRTSENFWVAYGDIAKTGETYDLATTQDQYLIDSVGVGGRDERIGEKKYQSAELIRESTLAELKADPDLFERNEDGTISLALYSPPMQFNEPHAWGMAIDMTTCIGCQACVIACQAENNVPIVGKDQVEHNRQMHWIRIDRYFKGEIEDNSPEVVFMPVTCQHCENAPCEQVCPVGATMHDTEGLNVMVYNRCVGTRYCSNNCPYKVRRFNYLDFQSHDPRHDKYPLPYLNIPDQQQLEQVNAIKRMVFNPEVTVRMRGVMEKCTFCVQRIHLTQINTRNATGSNELADGAVVTACQQVCPTRAIVFGDLNDQNSEVTRWHRNKRSYDLLGDLNTNPRNKFLAKISNPVEGNA